MLKGVCVPAGCVLGVCVQGGLRSSPKAKIPKGLASISKCWNLSVSMFRGRRVVSTVLFNICIYIYVFYGFGSAGTWLGRESRFDLIFELSAVPR